MTHVATTLGVIAAVLGLVFVVLPAVRRHTLRWAIGRLQRRHRRHLTRRFGQHGAVLHEGPGALAAVTSGGRALVLDLRDAFVAHVERSGARVEAPPEDPVADALAALARTGPPEFDATADTLVPLVVRREEAEGAAAAAGVELVGRGLSGALMALLRYRDGAARCLLTASDAGAWTVDDEALWRRATSNLTRLTRETDVYMSPVAGAAPDVLRLHTSDGLGAARVLIGRGLLPAGGAGYALVLADRDSIFLCPVDEPGERLLMAHALRRHRGAVLFPLSDRLLRLEKDGTLVEAEHARPE
jgi:hypothetical protein